MQTYRLLILIACTQLLFWYGVTGWFTGSRHIFPELHILPPVPSKLHIKAASFGDEQLYFRTQALTLQNAGDTFGRFTPLKHYDYQQLERWFMQLNSLDPLSHFLPSLASYIFSQTQHPPDNKHIVRYLEHHAQQHPSRHWWWLSQAVYIANHKLNDKPWALKLAYQLASIKGNIPLWARQMPAFIHRDLGEKDASLAIMQGIARSVDNLSPGELQFMEHFIRERLGYLEQ